MHSINHKTGYLYQFNGNQDLPAVESWHRTLLGAEMVKIKENGRGSVYRLTGNDTSERIG